MMTATDIKKCLLDAEVTASAVARSLNLTPSAVTHVIHGRRATPYIRRALANAIGKTYLEVWGEEDPGTAAASGVHGCTPVADPGAA